MSSRRKQARPRSCKRVAGSDDEEDSDLSLQNEARNGENDEKMVYISNGEAEKETSEKICIEPKDVKSELLWLPGNKATEDGRFRCDICSSLFTNLDDFMDHKNLECIPDHSEDQQWTIDTLAANVKQADTMMDTSPDSMDSPVDSPESPGTENLDPELLPAGFGVSELNPYGCQFCDKSFPRLSYLKIHEQIHSDQLPFKCDYCNRLFRHKRSRDRHVKLHTGDKNYKCNQCDSAFARSDHLKSHLRTHENGKTYMCETCDVSFTSASALTAHKLTHKSDNCEALECPQCQEIFLTLTDLQLHQLIHSTETDNQKPCSFCGQIFTRQENLDQHVQSVHVNGHGNKCPLCDAYFMDPDQLCSHIKVHRSSLMDTSDGHCGINVDNGNISNIDHGNLGASNQGRLMGNEETRLKIGEETRLTMNEVLVCPYCFCSDFDSLEILEIHMQSVHNVKPTEVYTCNYCNAPYQNLYSLHEHMRAVHQEQPCMDIKYPCSMCTRHFPSIDALIHHKRSDHYNEAHDIHEMEPLYCIYCSLSFKNHRALREHTMLNHSPTPTKLRSCLAGMNTPVNGNDDYFNKRDIKPQNITRNDSTTHDNPSEQNHFKEQIICDHCNSTFYDMKNYEAHVKLHMDEMTSKYVCKICKEKFLSEDRLEKHASSHYLSMTTEYGCTTCMKLFCKPDELQKHLMDIHAHHLYRCSLCKEIFDSKVNIQVHFAIKHSNECKLYKCTKCESVFRSEMEWQVHVRVNHLHVAKPYRCLFCKESFTAEIDLQCHLTTHNKPFRCSMCEQSFHVEYLLDKHLQSEHSSNSDHVVLPQLSPLKIKVERDTSLNQVPSSASPKSGGAAGIGMWKSTDFNLKPLQCSTSPKIRDGFGMWKNFDTTFKPALVSPDRKSEGMKRYDNCMKSVYSSTSPKTSESAGVWKNSESSIKPVHCSPSPKNGSTGIWKSSESSIKPVHCSPSPKNGSAGIWKSSEILHTCNICDAKFEQQTQLLTHKAVDHGLSAKMSSASNSPVLHDSPKQEMNSSHGTTTSSESANESMSLPVVVVSEKVCLACMFCSQTFKNRADLDKHIKIHSNGGSQKCNICDQVFPTSNILAEHKLTHCKIQHGNSCVLCKIQLKNEEHFYVHTQEHGFQSSGFMQCLVCRQTLSSMIELQMHGKHHFQMKSSFYTCCVCLKTFDTKENLVSKLNSNGRAYYVCKPCYHGNNGGTHVCQQCGAQFSNASHLDNHMCTHSKNTYQCIKCQESFSSEYEIQVHVATHVLNEGNTHECKLCLKTFESPAKLQCHLIEHTYKDSEFRCSVCCKLFQNSLEIQTHAIEHGLNSRRYACSQCPQKFFFSAELENHMYSHTDYTNPLTCSQCDRSFTSIINLNNHKKIHEKKEQSFKCSLCPKVLTSMSALQQHFFTGHSNAELATSKKVFPCTECDKEFPCLSNLQGHMRIHKPGVKFPCPVCKKVFALSRNLNIHMRSHSGEKPYECPICRKRFARKENRKAHLRSHGGLKPFLCPVCGKSFTRKCHVKEHMKVHFTQDSQSEMQGFIEVDVNGDVHAATSEDSVGQEVNTELSPPVQDDSTTDKDC